MMVGNSDSGSDGGAGLILIIGGSDECAGASARETKRNFTK